MWKTAVSLCLAVFVCTVVAQDDGDESCDRLDLVFVVDSSGSICDKDDVSIDDNGQKTCPNWVFVHSFLKDIVEEMTIGITNVRVAMVVYGNKGHALWNFLEYPDADRLSEAIEGIRWRDEKTNTSGALREAYNLFSLSEGDRTSVSNVAIVITDGVSNVDNDTTISSAEALRDDKNCQIFSIGITDDIKEEELAGISSEPHRLNSNYFKSASFSDLATILDTLVNATCSTPTVNRCSKEIDLLFILDGSDAVQAAAGDPPESIWEYMKGLLVGLVARWGEVGDTGAHVAVIVYADDAEIEISLDDYDELFDVIAAIEGLDRPGGDANLDDALQLARNEVFAGFGDRRAATNVVVLITAGEPDDRNGAISDSEELQNTAQVYVVGVQANPGVSENTLRALSSEPKEVNTNYWLSFDFESLDSVVLSLEEQIDLYLCNRPPVPDSECELDVLLLVDSSGSIQDADPPGDEGKNWEIILFFLEDFVSSLLDATPDTGETRVALVRFSTSANIDFYLDEYIGKPTELIERIRTIKYDGHWTNTPEAFEKGLEVFDGARGDRPKARNVVLILTDGKPETDSTRFLIQETLDAADALKAQKGAIVYAIGVTTAAVRNPISDVTLQGISSNPQKINQNYWQTASFSALFGIVTTLTEATCDPAPKECNIDLIFVLDYSSSIGHSKYTYIRDFVSTFVNDMDIGGQSRVGVVLFSDEEILGFQLNTYTERKAASEAVEAIEYGGGRTNTGAAIEYMRNTMFTQAMGDRPDIPNVAIVLTDGGSNKPDKFTVIGEAREAKKMGIHMLVVGLGKWIDKQELVKIASYPWEENLILVPELTELIQYNQPIHHQICDDVNECDSDPCQNGADCEDGINMYWCRCPSGFVGINCGSVCREPADIAIALDSSGSVGRDDFQLEVDFIADVIRYGLNMEDFNRFAAEKYDDEEDISFYLNTYTTNKEVLDGFDFYYDGGSTDTAAAIETMRTEFFISGNGDRSNFPNVGVVVTDGRSNDADATWQQAMQLRGEGAHMIAVGVGNNIRENELEGIASDPVSSNVLRVDDFASISSARPDLVDLICNNDDDCDPNPCQNSGSCTDLRGGYTCECRDRFTGNACERECSGKIDLVIILDSSGSVRSRRFRKVLDFAVNVVSGLEISPDKTRVGAVIFSDDASVAFELDTYSTKQDIVQHLKKLQYMSQRTHTSDALEKMMQDVFTRSGDRDDVDNICIIITNANSNIEKELTLPTAIQAKNQDIYMISVGVGSDVDWLELRGLASQPHPQTVFNARSENDLPDLVDDLIGAVCNDVNECDSDPCQNGGTCDDLLKRYMCSCEDDFTGINCERRCTSRMDLVFVLDLSGSTDIVYNVITNFTQYVVYGLNMNFGRVQIGAVIYSDNSDVWFSLDSYEDKREVLNALSFPKAGGKTNTQDALNTMRRDVFTSRQGDRSGVDNRAVIITDGHSNIQESNTGREAQAARDDDIELFVVAVGRSPGLGEVNDIASDPDSEHVYRVRDVSEVEEQAQILLDALCQ